MTTQAKPVTYDDYLTLPDDGKKYEIIDGELIMSPSPGTDHQKISIRLAHILFSHVSSRKLGEVLEAPTDVVLSMTEVVQPDIVFISSERTDIITKKNIIAAPDLVIEILSESTETLDRVTKKNLYERYGVREYWIVDPAVKIIEQYILENKAFRFISKFESGQSIDVRTIEGLGVKLKDVFGA